MPRPRLIDVAREAGVSVGAASDALSGKNRITAETRQRVRAAAERLGYVPNPIARAMTAGHLPLIALVLTGLHSDDALARFRRRYCDAVGVGTLAASERGYALVVLPDLQDPRLATLGFGGVITVDAKPEDPSVRRALDLGLPVLCARDGQGDGAEAPQILRRAISSLIDAIEAPNAPGARLIEFGLRLA